MDFFSQVIDNNPATLGKINGFKGEVYFSEDGDMLIFSLAGLHQLLTDLNVSYANFRKAIYQGELNQQLLAVGRCVELHVNRGKVDESLYKLVKIQ